MTIPNERARCKMKTHSNLQKNGSNKTNRPSKEAALASFEGRFLCIILGTGYFVTDPSVDCR